MVSPNAESTHTYPCYCGQSFCRGTMFCNPAQADDFWDNFVEKAFAPYIKSLPPPGQHLPKLASYPDKLPDNTIYDLYGNTKLPTLDCQDTKLPKISTIRQKIRNSGLTLSFPKLDLKILGVSFPNHILITPLLD
jgi:hypothetical protein